MVLPTRKDIRGRRANSKTVYVIRKNMFGRTTTQADYIGLKWFQLESKELVSSRNSVWIYASRRSRTLLLLPLSLSSFSSSYFQFLYLLVTSELLQRTFQRNRFNTKEVRLPDGPRHSSSSYNFTTQRAKKQEVPSRFHPIPIKAPQNDVPMS